jgi:hypothetical protein
MTGALAKRIIEYREASPFKDWRDVQNISGMNTIGQQIGKTANTKSTDFRVTSTATVNEITRVIESIVDTSKTVRFWREG